MGNKIKLAPFSPYGQVNKFILNPLSVEIRMSLDTVPKVGTVFEIIEKFTGFSANLLGVDPTDLVLEHMETGGKLFHIRMEAGNAQSI